nr:hypothetical protein [Enterococcus faecium]
METIPQLSPNNVFTPPIDCSSFAPSEIALENELFIAFIEVLIAAEATLSSPIDTTKFFIDPPARLPTLVN